jgi:hypothetical protein
MFSAAGVAAASGAAIAIAAAACGPSVKDTPKAGTTMSPAIIEPYLKIQAALARDSIDDVKANAGNIATAATALGAPAMKIDMAAVQLTSTSDLAEARDRFGALSEAIVTYMDGLHLTPPAGVRVAFCPMVKKPWLQQGETIANPYYGSDMPTCGDFR